MPTGHALTKKISLSKALNTGFTTNLQHAKISLSLCNGT